MSVTDTVNLRGDGERIPGFQDETEESVQAREDEFLIDLYADVIRHPRFYTEGTEQWARTEIERRLRRPVAPPPCPQCSGSGRAWVHDAAGGYGTTCQNCDGTGIR